jgi:ParB family chromosome partitioning protein
MTVERPQSLVMKDITIKRNELQADSCNIEITAAAEVSAAPTKPKLNLLAGLISDDAQGGNMDNYEMISANLLDPFFDHPFNAYSEEEMIELTESVKLLGVVNPVIVRVKPDGRYEILAGHNRTNAAKRAGLRTIPCKVIDADDDLARLIVTDTNLKQRQKLSYSEKARAYKMQLDALKKQGKRRDLLEAVNEETNLWSNRPQVKSRDIVAELNSTSAKQISRHLRLLKLEPGLLNQVDTERIVFTAGVELSYLSQERQEQINALLSESENLTVSIQAAETLRSMESENLTDADLLDILLGRPAVKEQEPKAAKFTPFKTAFKAAEKQFKKVDHYIAQSIDQEDLNKVVIDAVEEYLLKLQKENETV